MAEEDLFIPYEPGNKSSLMREGQVMITPELGGMQTGISPVAMQEEVAAPAPSDPMEFFGRRAPVADRTLYNEERKNWFDAFARQFHNRKFTDLNDYMDFVENLSDVQGGSGALGFQEILPFIQKQALENMPPNVKTEYQNMQAQKQDDAIQARQMQKIDDFNNNPENKKRGFMMGPDGKAKLVDPNLAFKRKQEILKPLAQRVKDVEAMQPKRSEFGTTSGEGQTTFDGSGYAEAMGLWRARLRYVDGAYEKALRGSAEADVDASMGGQGESDERRASMVRVLTPNGQMKLIPHDMVDQAVAAGGELL